MAIIDDYSLKTRVIPSELSSFDSVRRTLHAEHKNKFVSVRDNDLFSMKPPFSRIPLTEHDILGMIDHYSLKNRVIPSELASFDRIR